MALKKGRAVSVKERPVYNQMTELVLDGTIHAFWLLEPNKVTMLSAPGAERETLTLAECTALFGGETTVPVRRTGKAELLALAKRLLDALIDGDLPESLVTDARSLIAAA